MCPSSHDPQLNNHDDKLFLEAQRRRFQASFDQSHLHMIPSQGGDGTAYDLC
jgi:hypothetical protein